LFYDALEDVGSVDAVVSFDDSYFKEILEDVLSYGLFKSSYVSSYFSSSAIAC
jgi:hypothetical protein